MEAIQALAKTLQISNREASIFQSRVSNMLREGLNQPDVQEEDET